MVWGYGFGGNGKPKEYMIQYSWLPNDNPRESSPTNAGNFDDAAKLTTSYPAP